MTYYYTLDPAKCKDFPGEDRKISPAGTDGQKCESAKLQRRQCRLTIGEFMRLPWRRPAGPGGKSPRLWLDPLAAWLTLCGRCPAGVALRHCFVVNQVRLALSVLAYNVGNFLRRLTRPESIGHWSLRSIQVKLIKIGAKVVRHTRQVIFQMAEVAVDLAPENESRLNVTV